MEREAVDMMGAGAWICIDMARVGRARRAAMLCVRRNVGEGGGVALREELLARMN